MIVIKPAKTCVELPDAFMLTGVIADKTLDEIENALKGLQMKVIRMGRHPALISQSSLGMLIIQENGEFVFSQIRSVDEAKNVLEKIGE